MYTYVATALVAGALAFGAAWKTQNWRYAAKELERTRIEGRDQLKKVERGDDAASAHEATKAKIETKYVTITRKVDRVVKEPVYRNVCLPPAGLQLANDAIAGGGAASEPEAEVSGPPAPR